MHSLQLLILIGMAFMSACCTSTTCRTKLRGLCFVSMLKFNGNSQAAESQHGISDSHNFIAVENMPILNKTLFI